jgi:predicted small secreted protein
MLLVMVLAGALILAGCETVKGAGRDMEKAGEWMQKKANE